jgi:AcrR family transcriptional regulator
MIQAPARQRLLDCAEELFAEHGLDGASLRAINAGAGLSPAALHYHFGNKQALLEALLERRMTVLMDRRGRLLDAFEGASEPPTARDVIEALIRPLAELLETEGEGGRRYLRLLCRLHADGDLDERFVLSRFENGVDRIEPMLQRALPDLSVGVVRLRLALAIDAMMRGLADWQKLAALWRSGDAPIARQELIASLIDFLVGGLEARTQLTLVSAQPASTRDGAEQEHPRHGEEA